MKKTGMKQKLISLALLMVLVLSLCPLRSFASAKLDVVSTTVTNPKVGMTPDFNPIAPSNAVYEVVPGYVTWYDETEGRALSGTDTFKNNHYYCLYIGLKGKNGYVFTEFPSSYAVNGQSAQGDQIDANKVLLYHKYFEVRSIEINYVSVTVTEPKSGEHPVFGAVIPSGVNYEIDTSYGINGVAWGDRTAYTMLDGNSVFGAGGKYSVAVRIKPKDGYSFAEESSLTRLINGYSGIVTSYENGCCLLRLDFDQLPGEIETVSATITPPQAGKLPSYDLSLPSNAAYYSSDYSNSFFKNDIVWNDAATGGLMTVGESTFESGHLYHVTMYLTPMVGYQFKANVTGYINGYQVPVQISSNGQVKLEYTFPETRPSDGWKKLNGNYYYYRNGYAVTGIQKIGSKYYYFNYDGVLQVGFILIEGKYYYFSKSDGSFQTGFVKDGGKYYYFSKSDGSMQTGLIKDGGYYYFNKTDGSMQFGFVKGNGKVYYFSKSNGKLQTGFVNDGGKYYYFNKTDGSLQTGWIEDSGKYYYFDPSTGGIHIGWLKYEGYYFYLDPSTGALVRNTKKTIDGKTYTFNSYGVCVGYVI